MKYFVFFMFLVCVSCKSEVTEVNKMPDKIENEETRSIDPLSESLDIEQLTAHQWSIDMVLDNGKLSETSPWQQSTINFHDDNSYTWEMKGNQEVGSYALDQEKNIILLTSKETARKSEWSVKHRRNMMVWIGTPQYNQQSIQLKLIKTPTVSPEG